MLNDLIWIFETSPNDCVYFQQSFGGSTKAGSSWDPIITEMGQRGWELTCVFEKPGQIVRTMTIYKQILLFFQRRIVS